MSLDRLREQINAIDGELVMLFSRRLAIASAIGDVKAAENLAIRHPEREEEVIRRSAQMVRPEFRPLVEKFMAEVIELSVKVQEDERFILRDDSPEK